MQLPVCNTYLEPDSTSPILMTFNHSTPFEMPMHKSLTTVEIFPSHTIESLRILYRWLDPKFDALEDPWSWHEMVNMPDHLKQPLELAASSEKRKTGKTLQLTQWHALNYVDCSLQVTVIVSRSLALTGSHRYSTPAPCGRACSHLQSPASYLKAAGKLT